MVSVWAVWFSLACQRFFGKCTAYTLLTSSKMYSCCSGGRSNFATICDFLSSACCLCCSNRSCSACFSALALALRSLRSCSCSWALASTSSLSVRQWLSDGRFGGKSRSQVRLCFQIRWTYSSMRVWIALRSASGWPSKISGLSALSSSAYLVRFWAFL